MKPGDLVHPFFEEENNTVGLLLEIDKDELLCSYRANILMHGQVYSIPLHQVREIK